MPGILAGAFAEAPKCLHGFVIYRIDPYDPVVMTLHPLEIIVPPLWFWRDGAFQPYMGTL